MRYRSGFTSKQSSFPAVAFARTANFLLYHWLTMRIGLAPLAILLLAAAIGCGRGLFRQYEYEEEMYLSLDGSATIYVNSSVPALNALRDAPFDARTNAPLDRAAVREYFTTPVTRVTRVSTSWRNNRRFVHVRLAVDDVRRLGEAPPFAWSS